MSYNLNFMSLILIRLSPWHGIISFIWKWMRTLFKTVKWKCHSTQCLFAVLLQLQITASGKKKSALLCILIIKTSNNSTGTDCQIWNQIITQYFKQRVKSWVTCSDSNLCSIRIHKFSSDANASSGKYYWQTRN